MSELRSVDEKPKSKEPALKESLESRNIPGGYDGERSPLQPPLRETLYDEIGKVSAELIVDPETGSTYNQYHPIAESCQKPKSSKTV